MKFVEDDGGRADAGFKGNAGDCVTRSIAIATQKPYREVYDELNWLAKKERPRNGKGRSSARDGVHRTTYHRYMLAHGWFWVPTMFIGSGCKVHLKKKELPKGRLVVRVSKHITAVIDGVIHDMHDPQRDGTRAVYGYYYGPS
jgi:hypothetical protein